MRTGFRLRRAFWGLLGVLVMGMALYHAAQQLVTVPPGHLDRTVETLLRWKQFLNRYGLWLHLGAHGLTYLYLILCWSRVVRWVDRWRGARGHTPLSAIEQRWLAVSVAMVCIAYESLLVLRYLG